MSPRTPEANEQIRAERKEEILNAAIKVFTYKGYAATKISDIAAAADGQPRAGLPLFKSKEEVYEELADRFDKGRRLAPCRRPTRDAAGEDPARCWR